MAKTGFTNRVLICFMTLLTLSGGCEKALTEKKIRIKGQIQKGKQESKIPAICGFASLKR